MSEAECAMISANADDRGIVAISAGYLMTGGGL
jgi:hypothetical protein